LLEHDTAGDPITGIRWTHKMPAGVAQLLRQLDIQISANTVARLLHNMDFSLRVNRKAIATDASPDRDQQFRYISSLSRACAPHDLVGQRQARPRREAGRVISRFSGLARPKPII
jgi:Rhodopirellula transposase DDE domain